MTNLLPSVFQGPNWRQGRRQKRRKPPRQSQGGGGSFLNRKILGESRQGWCEVAGICLSVCLSVCLCLSVCFSASLLVHRTTDPSTIYLSNCLSIQIRTCALVKVRGGSTPAHIWTATLPELVNRWSDVAAT